MSKEIEEKLEYKVFARVGKKTYEQLSALLQRSRCRTMSSLIRNILTDREIIVKTYDASLDKVMEELCRVRAELQSIGVNINQVTHRFHREELPEGKMFQALEIVRLYQQTDLKVSELFRIIAQLSEQWLPK